MRILKYKQRKYQQQLEIRKLDLILHRINILQTVWLHLNEYYDVSLLSGSGGTPTDGLLLALDVLLDIIKRLTVLGLEIPELLDHLT